MRLQPVRLALAAAVCGLGLCPLPSRGEDPPVTREAECRWVEQAPTIDGKLDDPAWKVAQTIENFPSFWAKTTPDPRHKMRAMLVWGVAGVYFAGVMTDADVRAYGTKRNDFLWNGDVFELFFKPSRDQPEYFEFQANPRSVIFEAAFTGPLKATAPFETSPTRGMTAVAIVQGTMDHPGDTDQGWTVEGMIPWSAFGPKFGRPEPGAEWSFAVCRYDYFGPEKTPPVLMSSAPLAEPSFHRTTDYGRLRFVRLKP